MDAAAIDLEARDPTPATAALHRELLSELLGRLSAEDRRVAELRAEGLAWAEVATRTGGTAEAIRKRHARACGRAARELGLEDAADG